MSWKKGPVENRSLNQLKVKNVGQTANRSEAEKENIANQNVFIVEFKPENFLIPLLGTQIQSGKKTA